MNKKRKAAVIFCFFFLCALLPTLPARADSAVRFSGNGGSDYAPLQDGVSYVGWKSGPAGELTLQTAEPVSHLYVEWLSPPERTALFASDDGVHYAKIADCGQFLHELFDFNPVQYLSLRSEKRFGVGEILPYAGDAPARVEKWEQPGEVDLLLVSAHPDDEYVYMGGALPYAVSEGKRATVVYLSYGSYRRQHEALHALWHCGIKAYPSFGPFPDIRIDSLEGMANKWGLEKVNDYLTGVFTALRPKILLAHDFGGEYGHGAHMLAASVTAALAPQTASVQKCYVHLYKEHEVIFNWREPLAAFGGKTALEVAKEAFLMHESQQIWGFTVRDSGRYNNARFGLYFSRVGYQAEALPLFGGLPLPTATPVITLAPTDEPTLAPTPTPTGAATAPPTVCPPAPVNGNFPHWLWYGAAGALILLLIGIRLGRKRV